MTPSSRCVNLVKSFEGFFTKAYRCPAGVWTIGYGTTFYANGGPVKEGDTCTADQAKAWLLGELTHCGEAVDRMTKVVLGQNQFDALCSFVYNVGSGNFQKSTLLKKLNNGDYVGAADELLKWNKGGGKVLPGLVKRRNAERDLFMEV